MKQCFNFATNISELDSSALKAANLGPEEPEEPEELEELEELEEQVEQRKYVEKVERDAALGNYAIEVKGEGDKRVIMILESLST